MVTCKKEFKILKKKKFVWFFLGCGCSLHKLMQTYVRLWIRKSLIKFNYAMNMWRAWYIDVVNANISWGEGKKTTRNNDLKSW